MKCSPEQLYGLPMHTHRPPPTVSYNSVIWYGIIPPTHITAQMILVDPCGFYTIVHLRISWSDFSSIKMFISSILPINTQEWIMNFMKEKIFLFFNEMYYIFYNFSQLQRFFLTYIWICWRKMWIIDKMYMHMNFFIVNYPLLKKGKSRDFPG